MAVFDPSPPPPPVSYENFIQGARAAEVRRQWRKWRDDSLRARFLDLRAKYPSKPTPFGSKDAGVDILTRAAQVDLQSDEALIDLVLCSGILGPGYIEHLKETQELPRTLNDIRDSAAVCYLLLSDIAEGVIRNDVFAWINEWTGATREILRIHSQGPEPEKVVSFDSFELESFPLEWIQLSSFTMGSVKHSFSDVMRALLSGVASVIRDVQASPPGLSGVFASRCEECLNPFVIKKAGHRFCSSRCTARHGQRRRRKEKRDVLGNDHLTHAIID